MHSPELQSKIISWRAKCVAGTITLEEMREAIKLMRGERVTAGQASLRKRSGPAKSADDLLSELGSI
ncbi:MAG: hypothetical protein ACRD2L_02705 [Terriglobia bacterium]